MHWLDDGLMGSVLILNDDKRSQHGDIPPSPPPSFPFPPPPVAPPRWRTPGSSPPPPRKAPHSQSRLLTEAQSRSAAHQPATSTSMSATTSTCTNRTKCCLFTYMLTSCNIHVWKMLFLTTCRFVVRIKVDIRMFSDSSRWSLKCIKMYKEGSEIDFYYYNLSPKQTNKTKQKKPMDCNVTNLSLSLLISLMRTSGLGVGDGSVWKMYKG